MKITAQTKVLDAVKMSKDIAAVFKKHNLDCLSCKGVGEETVEKVAVLNGMDVNEFINELNKAVKG